MKSPLLLLEGLRCFRFWVHRWCNTVASRCPKITWKATEQFIPENISMILHHGYRHPCNLCSNCIQMEDALSVSASSIDGIIMVSSLFAYSRLKEGSISPGYQNQWLNKNSSSCRALHVEKRIGFLFGPGSCIRKQNELFRERGLRFPAEPQYDSTNTGFRRTWTEHNATNGPVGPNDQIYWSHPFDGLLWVVIN